MKLTSNGSAYTPQQLQRQHRRQLLSSGAGHADVERWLHNNSRVHGSYMPSNALSRSSTDGTLDFAADGTASNGSLVGGLTNALVITGTSRWPAAYTTRELNLSVIALFAVLAAATLLQGVVLGLWKLFRFDPNGLPK